MGMQAKDSPGGFPTTRWSMVAVAGRAQGDERRDALQAMLPRYLPALRSHLIYGRRLPADVCEDVLQSFVAEKILGRNLIALARQERGRFRAFLTVSLDRFALNYLRAQRSAGRRLLQCEELEAVGATDSETPSLAFDVEWARGLLGDTLELMERECKSKKRHHVWEIFKARTLRPVLENCEPTPYQMLVEQMGFLSPSQAANALITANRMFVRILRETISTYAQTEAEVDDEVRQLQAILSSAGAGSGRGRV